MPSVATMRLCLAYLQPQGSSLSKDSALKSISLKPAFPQVLSRQGLQAANVEADLICL